MKSHEALHTAIDKDTAEVAKALHLSIPMVSKWKEPTSDWTDSGALNPLDRIEAIIAKALQLGRPVEAAMAPIYYLTQQFSHIAIPLPKCDNLKDLSDELMEAIKEFGHLASVAAEAMADGRISKNEFAAIEEEGTHLIRHAAAFIEKTREAIR